MRPSILVISSLCIAVPAITEASTASVDFPLELQFQDVALEPAVEVELGSGLSLETVVVYESAAPNAIGAEEVLLRREGEWLSLWGGKFNPQFGNAWDQDVAVFDGHAANYELTEKMGLGAALHWGGEESSRFRVSANLFGDRSNPSYTMSLEAKALEGLTLTTATMLVDEEQGLLLGAHADFSVGERQVAPLVEVARLADQLLLSMGLAVEDGGMRYTLQNSARRSAEGDESIVQATASWSL